MPLDREQWIDAALVVLERDGVAAVAVEPLTRVIGVTKGSFYWHFKGRSELLRAALERWADVHVTAPLEKAREVGDPAERLQALFSAATGKPGSIFVRLLDAATDPIVKPILYDAAHARIRFMEQAYRELGRSETQARQDAILAYSAYIGRVHLQREAPDVLGEAGVSGSSFLQRLLDSPD